MSTQAASCLKGLNTGAAQMDLYRDLDEHQLFAKVAEIYSQHDISEALSEVEPGHWSRETINRWAKGKAQPRVSVHAYDRMRAMLPAAPSHYGQSDFRFIDLFAGIGGLRRAFDSIGGECVFTSEWDRFAVRTYKANHYCDPMTHSFNNDIRDITKTQDTSVDEATAYRIIDQMIPDHEVLLAGFPCQPFSLAGVSKKESMGRKHGFECDTQGTLFFDLARIVAAKNPPVLLLENVKNLKSHDKGETFKVICNTLEHDLGYDIVDVDADAPDPKIVDAAHFVPQHRERIVLVCLRKDLNLKNELSLADLSAMYPEQRPSFGDILESVVPDHFTLSQHGWEYLFNYAAKHKAKGNGFGFGLTGPEDTARTLSARYHKDGSEILVDQGFDPTQPIDSDYNRNHRPRMLMPKECARLMGFDAPGESNFILPVSRTQAYRQFGNSVVVPVFEAIAAMMRPYILSASGRKQGNKAAEEASRPDNVVALA